MRSIWCGCWIGSVGWLMRRRRRRRVGWRSRRCGRRRVIVRRRTGWPGRPASVWVRRSSCWRRRRSVAAAPVVQEALVGRCGVASSGAGGGSGGEGAARARVRGWWRRPGRCRSPSSRPTPTGSWPPRRARPRREGRAASRKKRMLRTGVDADGMGYGHWLLRTGRARPVDGVDRGARRTRSSPTPARPGVREPSEAYAADALARRCADLPTAPAPGAPTATAG